MVAPRLGLHVRPCCEAFLSGLALRPSFEVFLEGFLAKSVTWQARSDLEGSLRQGCSLAGFLCGPSEVPRKTFYDMVCKATSPFTL